MAVLRDGVGSLSSRDLAGTRGITGSGKDKVASPSPLRRRPGPPGCTTGNKGLSQRAKRHEPLVGPETAGRPLLSRGHLVPLFKGLGSSCKKRGAFPIRTLRKTQKGFVSDLRRHCHGLGSCLSLKDTFLRLQPYLAAPDPGLQLREALRACFCGTSTGPVSLRSAECTGPDGTHGKARRGAVPAQRP